MHREANVYVLRYNGRLLHPPSCNEIPAGQEYWSSWYSAIQINLATEGIEGD